MGQGSGSRKVRTFDLSCTREGVFWKRHIDQLKDLSGTKIQPHWQEQIEDCEVNVPQSFAAYSPTKTPVTTVGHFPLHK